MGNNISAIAKDSQGNIWFASKAGSEVVNGMNGGLAKYDGSNWINYDYNNTGIFLANINSITIDNNDVVWLGHGMSTASVSVIVFDSVTWTIYDSTNTNLPNHQVNNIFIDNNNVKWISTLGGLVKFNNITWEVYNTSNSNIPDNSVYDVAIDSNGIKWIATDNGLVEFNDVTWINHMVGYHIYGVAIDDTDVKWIAVWKTIPDPSSVTQYSNVGKGMTRFITDYNYTYYVPSNSNIAHVDVYTVYIGQNGDKLLGTGNGLSIFDDMNWQNINPSKLPIFHEPQVTINQRNRVDLSSMKIDSNGNKWFAVYGAGIAKFDGTNWQIYDLFTSGIHCVDITSICITVDDHIWFGTKYHGIGYFDGASWISFTSSNSDFPNDSSGGTVDAIDNNGILWGRLNDLDTKKGIFKYNGTHFTQYNTANANISSNSNTAIQVDLDNIKWFGNTNDLVSYNDVVFTNYNSSNSGMPSNGIVTVKINHNGQKWIRIGTGGFFGSTPYLVSFDGTIWNAYASTPETGFSFDPEENLWFGSVNDGISKYSGIDASYMFTLDYSNSPISHLKVENPVFDGNTAWIITRAGLSSFVMGPPSLTYVPDDNFEQKLIDLGYDDVLDDYVLTRNIEEITQLVINNANITDLTGIEDFTSLRILSFAYNQITSFDISQNRQLTDLYCAQNPLTTIDISQNTLLKRFYCDNNPMVTSVNFEYNTNLEVVSCINNQIQYANLSNCRNLIQADFRNNNLFEMDIRNGNNYNITNNYFVVHGNPNLQCVYVDNKIWSSNNWHFIDSTANFVETEIECRILSIKENANSSISIYPNPTNSIVYISNYSEIAKIEVYNIFGQLIFKKNNSNFIDISILDKGIYILNIEDDKGKNANFKVVRN